MKSSVLEIQCSQRRVANFNAGRITPGVKLSAYSQTCLRRRLANQLDNHLVTNQRSTAPVLSNVAEHSVFNLIPLAGAGWKMAESFGRHQEGTDAEEQPRPRRQSRGSVTRSVEDQQLMLQKE